jgi:hypothetical protein
MAWVSTVRWSLRGNWLYAVNRVKEDVIREVPLTSGFGAGRVTLAQARALAFCSIPFDAPWDGELEAALKRELPNLTREDVTLICRVHQEDKVLRNTRLAYVRLKGVPTL